MTGWIQKQLDPPGLEKKNRGSLFRVIGEVFSVVRDDAVKAFNAHFPYLADLQKLAEHGKALNIPRFPHDTDEEYRERVSAASFFHMKAGERGYIHQQLERRFGSQYLLTEKFLEVSIKILDLSEEDFIWLRNFFDGIFDPNILFIIEKLFNLNTEIFAGISPVLNNVIRLKAIEDDAAVYTAVKPQINCLINILIEEVIL